jgi:hypothetical protein
MLALASKDGVLLRGEPHVAANASSLPAPAGPAADLRDRHDRQLTELVSYARLAALHGSGEAVDLLDRADEVKRRLLR